ncbi:MAG: polymer-forming cytoskeletal protein [Rubricoccaceae bacterium]
MALFRSDTPASSPDGSAPTAARGAVADQHNIIGRETTIEGTLRAKGNVHVSGTIRGNVDVEGRTVVMPGGTVEGELVSTSAEVGGRVEGRVVVRERLVLKATAVVEGDIRTDKLIIEDGAAFNGVCEMGPLAEAAPAAGRIAPGALPDQALSDGAPRRLGADEQAGAA